MSTARKARIVRRVVAGLRQIRDRLGVIFPEWPLGICGSCGEDIAPGSQGECFECWSSRQW